MRQRRGSIVAFAISLTAIFLTVIVAMMSYFESANRQANNEKWADVAEEAARSGLDFVLGWGETSLDEVSRLPSSWEMQDGQALDPINAFANTSVVGVNFNTRTNATSGLPADPSGAILGSNIGEYVLGRVGNYVVSFKARVQQFRMSDDAPRQYRIGVTGRVRKVSTNNINADEAKDIVGERFLMATIGKEPFSRYAALIDIDLVRNWIPGEEVNGPVHINRGYIDKPDKQNRQWTAQSFKDERSMMKLKTTDDPGNGFQAVTGAGLATNNPVFNDTVTMTAYNDKDVAGSESDDSSPDNTATPPDLDGQSFLQVNTLAPTNSTAKTIMGRIFLSPDNLNAFKGGPGPIIVPSPIPLPQKSRQRIPTALGLQAGTDLAGCTWYPTLEDGLYVPTVSWVTTQLASTSPNYANGIDYPAGGIYLRGNVEVMRMYVNGQFSYYMFQMGYGGWESGNNLLSHSVRRVYMVKVDRTGLRMTLRAFPSSVTSPNTTQTSAVALRNILTTAGGNPEYYFTGAGAAGSDPSGADWAVNTGGNISYQFAMTSASFSQFPFNGIILVDSSKHDPQFNTVAGVPMTGNIYNLGNPGTPAAPYNKGAWPNGQTAELVATNANANPSTLAPASKLTIVTAGHIFIQNDIKVESIRALQGNTATTNNGDDPQMDAVTLSKTRDLLGLVADRQVIIGLAAPSTPGTGARKRKGIVVHAAVAALGDPAPTARSGQLAYWGSFTTEAILPCFGDYEEDYKVIDMHGAVGLDLPAGKWNAVQAAALKFVGKTANANANAGNRNMPGNPYYMAYTNWITLDTNPNNQQRGRLTMFGSLTQRKRGAIGYGNSTYDKDLRYDKRLLSIAPPMFPSSATVALRVSTVRGAGVLPYVGHNGGRSPVDPDYNFMGVPVSNLPQYPAP